MRLEKCARCGESPIYVRLDETSYETVVLAHRDYAAYVNEQVPLLQHVFGIPVPEAEPKRGAPYLTITPDGMSRSTIPRNTPCDACSMNGGTNFEPCPVHQPHRRGPTSR